MKVTYTNRRFWWIISKYEKGIRENGIELSSNVTIEQFLGEKLKLIRIEYRLTLIKHCDADWSMTRVSNETDSFQFLKFASRNSETMFEPRLLSVRFRFIGKSRTCNGNRINRVQSVRRYKLDPRHASWLWWSVFARCFPHGVNR